MFNRASPAAVGTTRGGADEIDPTLRRFFPRLFPAGCLAQKLAHTEPDKLGRNKTYSRQKPQIPVLVPGIRHIPRNDMPEKKIVRHAKPDQNTKQPDEWLNISSIVVTGIVISFVHIPKPAKSLPIKNALRMQPISVTDSSYVSKKLSCHQIFQLFYRGPRLTSMEHSMAIGTNQC